MPDLASQSQFRSMRDAARSIFLQALADASIRAGFARHVQCKRGILRVSEDLYDLNSYSRVLGISLGKAAHTMVEALSAQVGTLVEGIVASSVLPESEVRGYRYFREDIPRRAPNRFTQPTPSCEHWRRNPRQHS